MKHSKLNLVLLFSVISGSLFAQFNYGEALQKSIYFYETQQSGPLPDWNRVSWRGDSAIQDGSDVGLDLTGGWYDAGDHVKFNFPMAYTVTTLAWGAIEFEDAYAKAGQLDIIKRNLRFVTDYLLKCHTKPNELYGQVAEGDEDHSYWGPAEVNPTERLSLKISGQNGGSDLAAETASALAAVSILLKTDDPTYSAELLQSATELYNYADNVREAYSNSITDAAGFYRSFSNYEDEIVWGAAWMYRATNDVKYLTKAEAEYDNMQREGQSATAKYKEAFSWDDKAYGVYVLLAQLTGKEKYKQDAQRNLDWWTGVGVDGDKVPTTPGNLPHIRQWGTLRYANNQAFLALVYSDKVSTSVTQKEAYEGYAKFMADYTLGNNPINRSFMVGYGNNPANKPHHRGAHGGWTNSCLGVPDTSSHILYGAVVGGPKSITDDDFLDDRCEFIANEVACDYNAGITGVLAWMFNKYGGTPLADFPTPDVPTRAEIRSWTKFNSNNASGSTVKVIIQNRTAWPARVTDKLSYRYYFDISEALEAGKTINDYNISLNGIGSDATMTVESVDESLYYAEITNIPAISPIGDPAFRNETQLIIRVGNGVPYDTSNDPSAQGINGDAESESIYIPVYDNNKLIFGEEPSGIAELKAKFEVDKTTGIAPFSVNFNASKSREPENGPLEYSWDFGNGKQGTGVNSSTVYDTPGDYTVTLTISNSKGELDSTTIKIRALKEQSCSFGAPLASDFPSLNTEFNYSHVVGNDSSSIDLSNVSKFTINWDNTNNGLYVFALNTTNGIPSSYVNLLSKVTHNFKSVNPEITITESGLTGLDDTYWVTIDEGNFALVSKTKEATVYFSNAAEAPVCGTTGGTLSTNSFEIKKIAIYPNPTDDKLFIQMQNNKISNISTYSITGSLIKSFNVSNTNDLITYDTSNLKNGMYLLKIKTNQGLFKIKKLVVKH